MTARLHVTVALFCAVLVRLAGQTRAATNVTETGAKTAAPDATVRYDVSGDDANGTALREVVVADGRVTYSLDVADRTMVPSGGSGNATGAVRHAGRVDNTRTNVTDGTRLVDTATATTATATTTTATTTTATTTTEKVKVSPKDDGPRKYCDCDLMTNGSCTDVNCCCDAECTECRPTSGGVIRHESILFDSSLFYVVIDNVPSEHYYPERDAVQSESRFASSTRGRDSFAWPTGGTAAAREPAAGHDLAYGSTRWLYTAASDADRSEIKPFGVKSGALDTLCAVERPVRYLVPTETRCRAYVRNLTSACDRGTQLSSDGYPGGGGGEGVFRAARPADGSDKTERSGLVTVRATAAHRCARPDGSAYECAGHAVYSRGVCRRAVVAVEYRVTHDGARGAVRVDALFRHRDVADAGRPVYVDQRFGVRFSRAADDGARARRGPPGYAAGAPLLWTTADGRRAGPPRACAFPPAFMQNADVRCSVRVRRTAAEAASADLCHGIQNETVAALGDYEGASVASLGDPDVAASRIPVVVVGPPAGPRQPSDGRCAAVIDRVHVQVLYAHVGAFDRPQAAVLGVLVNYTASPVAVAETTRDDEDDDEDGNATTVAEVPVRATVSFVDLTGEPVRAFAEPPTYEFRLPEDFYYPFWSSAPRSRRAAVGLSAAVPLACVARAYL